MTPDQKTALKQALDQHSFRMSVKDAAPEDVAQLPEDFQVPSYSANTSPLYENQLFPKITSADDLINLGYATPEGVPTESGQMAIALKKAGALNDDYTLNDTGKAMMASREDLLKEENLPLYMKSKELDLDDAGELSWGEVGSNFLNELKKGGKNLIDLAGYDTSSMTPQEKASFDLQSQAAVGGLVKAGAILPMGLSQIVGNATIKAISDNESEENLGLALLNQKFEKQSDEINNAKTAEVVDAMGQMFGAELGMEEARQQDIQTVGAERAQKLESGGESAGGVAAMFTPGGPSMLTAKVAFGVGSKGLGAAFKPISRSLLQADAKAAMVLDKTKQLASLQRQAGALQLTTQAAERQAAIGESMAQKFSQAGFTDRANNALRLANQARTKGQEAAVRLGGFADEIATVSDDLAKATQSATVADKVLQITQKAGQIPYLPITALGKTLEYTGRGMIGIDKGLSNLASKIGADKAYNAMNKITTLSGLGGVGAASGLGPAAFIPAAIKTAWSTAPYIKATGEYVGLMGKEAMKARGQIGFWKRMYEMPNKGPMHRAVSGLMDTATAGGRVTGAAGRVGKGLVASYPVDLAFEWVAEGGEMNPNVLKQAAVETLVFGGTGAALGGITMGSAEKIRSLQNGDATNFYRSITDPSQRVMFNGMAPDLKRAIGTFSASNPGAKIEFVTQGEGAYDRNTKTVMVNPTSRNPLKPLLTHEFMHHMLNNGIGDGVVAQLVGDGYQTGGILRSKDGGYEPQYEAFKDEYVNRLRQQHERNIKLRDAIGDPVSKSERQFQVPDEKYLAEEYFIETNVDDMLGLVESGKLGKMAGRMVINDKVRALGDAILNKSAILRDLHFRIGGVMDKQGKMVKGNGFLGGQLYQSPEIRRMFNKMVNESVGRRGGVDAAKMKARNGIELPITGKNDPVLGEMSSLWESDVDGSPLTDKNGDYIPLSKQTDELRSQAGMLLIDDMRARQARGEVIEDGELAYNPDNNTWSGQYLTDRQIDLLALSGRFNNKQIKQLKLMNQAARATSDPNADPAARGHRFSVIYQPALKKNRKGQWRYDQIKPQLRDVVPYGVEISKDGNILIRIMSTNQLFANVSEKATTKRGRSLYNGDMDSILRDANAIIDLHGKNQATDAYFKEKYGAKWESHKEFINSVFGNVGKGHKDINPLVASDRVDAVVKSYRLDRMNKATQLVGATQLPYQNNLIKINYLPEGEPILDANGEPKDLRYTPRYEDRMPEQRQMPEVSPENLNPVANKQEAQGLWADGKRMFALNEMDEKLTPITSKAMLDSYSADAIGWMEPEQAPAPSQRFMLEGDQKPQQAKQWNPNPIVATNKAARAKGIPERITDELFELIKNKPIVVGMADLLGAGGKIRGVDVSGGPGYPIQNFDPAKPDDITGVWASERGGINTILQNMVKTDSIWQDESGHNWALFAPHTMAQSAHKSNAQTPEIYISKVNDMAISGALKKATASDLSDHIRANVPVAKDMPNIGTEKLTKFIHDAAFETRAAIMSELSNVRSRDLGAPSPETILTESRDPQYHGVEKNALTGLLLIDVDRLATKDENGNWKLRSDISADDFNIPKHPSYGTVMPGKVLAHFDNPVPFRISTPEMINTMRAASPLSRIDYLLARMPKDKGIRFQPLTDQIKNAINEAQNISGNVPYIREAVKAVNGNWRKFTSGASLKGLAELIGAIHRSPARDSLTQYNLSELQKMIKEDKMEVHQLGDNDIWFGVKKSKDGNELVSVVNNTGIPGMLNLIMQRALEVGVNKLDAYAVPTSKTPNGLLPSLYKRYGWKEVERMPFDRQYLVERKKGEKKADHEEKIAQKEAALKMFWTEQGWDGQSNPDVVFMTYEKGRKTEITSGQSEGSLVKQRVAESGAASEATSGEVRGAGLVGGREQATVGGPTQGDSGTGEGVLPRGFDSIVQGLRSASPVQIETIGITDAERKQFLKKLGVQ